MIKNLYSESIVIKSDGKTTSIRHWFADLQDANGININKVSIDLLQII